MLPPNTPVLIEESLIFWPINLCPHFDLQGDVVGIFKNTVEVSPSRMRDDLGGDGYIFSPAFKRKRQTHVD